MPTRKKPIPYSGASEKSYRKTVKTMTVNNSVRLLPTLLAAALCLTISTAFARIGETEPEIEQRYGKALAWQPGADELGQVRHAYLAGDLAVIVTFDASGRSEQEVFKRDGDAAPMRQEEQAMIMQANCTAGAKWQTRTGIGWITSDEKLVALRIESALIVCTAEHFTALKAARGKSEQQRLSRF
jgi:hypothetical protein